MEQDDKSGSKLTNIRVSIIGLGLMGGSVAKALKSSGMPVYITAFDRAEVLDAAFGQKVIDEKALFADDACNSDIVFLCLPTDQSLEILEKIAPLVNEGTIITDVAGVKSIFEMKWSTLKSKGKFIGGHPMTGKKKRGV
jgi:prephenate dehydrogenase